MNHVFYIGILRTLLQYGIKNHQNHLANTSYLKTKVRNKVIKISCLESIHPIKNAIFQNPEKRTAEWVVFVGTHFIIYACLANRKNNTTMTFQRYGGRFFLPNRKQVEWSIHFKLERDNCSSIVLNFVQIVKLQQHLL